MAEYVNSSISTIETVMPRIVSETALSLKVFQEMDSEMKEKTSVAHMEMDMMVPGFHIIYLSHILIHRQKVRQLVIDGSINISACTLKRFFHNFAKLYEHIKEGNYDLGHE
eukprot:13348920-Ditylum_brightwellii.AAC.1